MEWEKRFELSTSERYCGDLSIAKSREITNGSEARSHFEVNVTVLEGEPAIVKNAYVTHTTPSILQEAYADMQMISPILKVGEIKTSIGVSAPVLGKGSGKMDVTISVAQPVRVDKLNDTDSWLANIESKAHKKWLG